MLTPAEQDALYARLNAVQARVAEAQRHMQELEAARDLAWTTYQTLNTKVAEVKVSAGTETEWVRVASPAVPPRLPVASRAPVSGAVGGVLGLVLGFLLALVLDYQRARAGVLQPAPRQG
jgi:uncharacterized protein involved in exopolysaccharide biosynthesis